MTELVKVIYKKIDTIEDMQAAIAKAFESVGTMKKRVQQAAVAILIMAAKAESDEEKTAILDTVNHFVNEIGDGVRGKGLVAFFAKYGFRLDVNEKKNGFIKLKQPDTIAGKLNDAKAEHWYTMSPENPFQDYDFKEQLRKLVKTARKKMEDEKHAEQIHVDTDMLGVIEALLNPEGKVKADGALKLVKRLATVQADVAEPAKEDVEPEKAEEVKKVA